MTITQSLLKYVEVLYVSQKGAASGLQGEGGFGKAYLQMFHLPLGKAPVGPVAWRATVLLAWWTWQNSPNRIKEGTHIKNNYTINIKY